MKKSEKLSLAPQSGRIWAVGRTSFAVILPSGSVIIFCGIKFQGQFPSSVKEFEPEPVAFYCNPAIPYYDLMIDEANRFRWS